MLHAEPFETHLLSAELCVLFIYFLKGNCIGLEYHIILSKIHIIVIIKTKIIDKNKSCSNRVKQGTSTEEAAKLTTPTVGNIVGTSKITRSGRIFSPEISPNVAAGPVRVPVPNQNVNARGKEPQVEQVQTPVEITAEDPSKQEMEEILKIICKCDYNIVEQLGHTASKISM